MPETTQRRQQEVDAPQSGQSQRQGQATDGALHDAAASGNYAQGRNATQPPAQLGDGPIPGEEAWLLDAMKFNRLQHYSPTQWKAIQRHVKAQDDGAPGAGTARGIYRWQQAKGLEADGMIGPRTFEVLQRDTAIPQRPPQPQQSSTGSQEPGAANETQSAAGTQAAGPDGKRNPSFEKDQTTYLAIVDQVTSVMETGEREGKYDMLHTLSDGGGISYGKHQVTLTSGTLARLLDTYLELAKKESPNAKVLREHMARVRAHDLKLRGEKGFLSALKTAASEPEMKQAQDVVFLGVYGKPAWDAAKNGKIESPLGYAMLYDTKIQGGMEDLLQAAEKKLGGRIGEEIDGQKIDERRFLSVFNDLREERLKRLAKAAKNAGQRTRAEMLANSAYRTQAFRELLQAGNLNVAGPAADVKIKGPGGDTYQVKGFDTKDVRGPTGPMAGLKAIGTATVTAGRLSVRAEPDADADRLETIGQGESYEVVEQRNGWLKIKLAVRTGWISADYAEFSAAPPQQETEGQAGQAAG